jgi:hypothetical protein
MEVENGFYRSSNLLIKKRFAQNEYCNITVFILGSFPGLGFSMTGLRIGVNIWFKTYME